MVVITSPPYPDYDRKGPRGNRNNYALAALSRLLQDNLSPHGLKVFDEFDVDLTIYVVSQGKVFMDMSASLLSECS